MKMKDFTLGASIAGATAAWAGLASVSNASCSGVCGSCGFGCVAPIAVIAALGIKKTKASRFRFLGAGTAKENLEESNRR